MAKRFVVSGRVQGVGFRFFVHEAATIEGLRGYVRNLPDGTVEAVAEGEAASVDRFSHKLWRGPSRARVEHVAAQTLDAPAGGHAGFRIQE